ncbi:MAG: hypothetical protein OEN00_17125 [Gemmatimonadota bacterium]|nr:hypothetical protein [Gemmatimonadota bacterium]
MTPGPSTTRTLIVLGALQLGLLAVLGWVPAAHRFPFPGLALFGAAFIAYALAARHLVRSDSVAAVGLIWLFAIAMRLALFPLTPVLSDDVYRYLWDGHVWLSGTNPYLYAPAAAELEGLRTAFHHLINNPTVPTIYPPLAQAAFLLVAALGSSIAVAKALWLACDLGTAVVLARIARETGRRADLVLLLYLWAPLLVVEVAWSAHLEPLGLLPMSLAILWARRASRTVDARASLAAGAALALSALTKFAPIAALPALARRLAWRLAWRPVVAFAVVTGILYLPFVNAGSHLFDGLRTYGEQWWFMKGAFGLVEFAVGDPDTARRIVAVAIVAVVTGTVFARFDLERALLWVLGAGMILTPTLHPWYVLWMLPMAALRGARAWLLLSGLAFLGYFGASAYQETGVWPQPAAVRSALWIPFLVVLALDAGRSLRADEALT